MEEYIYNVVLGALGAMFVSGSQAVKAFQAGEDFNLGKFINTLILGAFVGGVAVFTGLSQEFIINLPMYGGATYFVENALKIINRKLGLW